MMTLGDVLAMKEGRADSDARYWIGRPPMVCQICTWPLQGVFIDGKVKHNGWWANMCPKCHKRWGIGIGPGIGQRYERQSDGRHMKVDEGVVLARREP